MIFYCDYFAQNNSITYSARGGRSTLGLYCGAFIVVVDITVSTAHWYRGACLSFKLIEYFYCDYSYQGANSRYLLRGGNSRNGVICGTFSVNAFDFSSAAIWHFGASISFKII